MKRPFLVLSIAAFAFSAFAEGAAADATNAVDAANAVNATNGIQSPIVMRGIMYSRTPGMRGKALAGYGAGGGDAIVMRALRWLRTVQNEDGSWPGNPVASTSLALWTYLDHNETPADDTEFGPTVKRGLQFLLADLDSETGLFRSARDEPFAQPLGAFAIALGHSMARAPLLREAGPVAYRPLFAGQRPDGAWNANPLDPSPVGRGDPRATAVCTLALRGSRQWRWDGEPFDPDGALNHAADALLAFLDSATGAVLRPDGTADPATPAVAYALQKMGRYNHPLVRKSVAFLEPCIHSYEAWDGPQPWIGSGAPLRDWFYVTEVKYQHGGRPFADWNKQFLPETQRRQTIVPAEESGYSDLCLRPREIGWWDSPSEHERHPGAGGPALPCKRWRGGECIDGETTLGDRVRDTCLATLPMMVYYAFLPASHFGLDQPPVEISPPRPKTNNTVRVNVRPRSTAAPATNAAPRELRVGPGEVFEKPSDAAKAAHDGDTVRIAAGTWRGDVCVWPQNDLTILGAGADATVLDAEGRAAAGKGLWVVRGTNVTIRGVSLRGAACPDRNGAGIRHEADGALTVTDCRFENNENGFLSGVATNAVLTFERCVFRDNGAGDGLSHNLYAGRAKKLVFRACLSDHAREGHALKSRALETIIDQCRFDDGDDGRSSYLVDCPNGGLVRIDGCRFVQSPVAPNGTMVSIGEEGNLHPASIFLRGANAFENRRTNGTEVRSFVPSRSTTP